MRNVQDYLRNGEIYVAKETFAVAKTNAAVEGVFAAITDKKETTIVIDQSKLLQCKDSIAEVSKDWKIITFDLLLPIDMVGFIAMVAQTLAEEGISILIVSAYSTDHVLVQEKDLQKAVKKLESFGCAIKER
ncbi:MAG: ACT domain-containing protein [Candidatus Wildermuthbacteria bacterium]|nr:ACT domain-containing protein [Candidatus Wildermuthbacteria bacterium]